MTPDQRKRLKELYEFVMNYKRAGKTYAQFWRDFDEAEKDIYPLVTADDPDPELLEAYSEIREAAHHLFGGPPEMMDKVMEG